MPKNYLKKTMQALRDNPWVYGPLFDEVKNNLMEIDDSLVYLERGTKKAECELEKNEYKHRSWVSSVVDLIEYPYCYPVNGATEAINQWRLSDSRLWQCLPGEYQWPRMVSSGGVERKIEDLESHRVLYLSNPSSVDGNFLSKQNLQEIYRKGCPVILDCAYVGAVRKEFVFLTDSIEQIFFSFSKGWGCVGQRAGLVYSKKPLISLERLKSVECWNYLAIQVMRQIMKHYSVDYMYNKYCLRQKEICQKFELQSSDTYFIGLSKDQFYRKRIRSGEKARLCLTPVWFDNFTGVNH